MGRVLVSKLGITEKSYTADQLKDLIRTAVNDNQLDLGWTDLGGVLINMVKLVEGVTAGTGNPLTALNFSNGILTATLTTGAPIVSNADTSDDIEIISRANALPGVAPTVAEVPAAELGEGKFVKVALNDGTIENWLYESGAWVLKLTESPAATSGKAFDNQTLGVVQIDTVRSGGAASSITNAGTGIYQVTATAGADVERIQITGNNTNLRADNALEIRFDNSANSFDRKFQIQIYNLATNQWSDLAALGINPTLTTSGNITTIVLSGMNGYGGTGYEIYLR